MLEPITEEQLAEWERLCTSASGIPNAPVCGWVRQLVAEVRQLREAAESHSRDIVAIRIAAASEHEGMIDVVARVQAMRAQLKTTGETLVRACEERDAAKRELGEKLVRAARRLIVAMCQGCGGAGYLAEVDIGVGTMREPCDCTSPQPEVVEDAVKVLKECLDA